MTFSGDPASLVLFMVGLLGVGMLIAGAVVAGHRRDHYLGGLLVILGLLVMALGFLSAGGQ
jgi:hypothetical protein